MQLEFFLKSSAHTKSLKLIFPMATLKFEELIPVWLFSNKTKCIKRYSIVKRNAPDGSYTKSQAWGLNSGPLGASLLSYPIDHHSFHARIASDNLTYIFDCLLRKKWKNIRLLDGISSYKRDAKFTII